MVVWNSMLLEIIIMLLGVVKQHVRFIAFILDYANLGNGSFSEPDIGHHFAIQPSGSNFSFSFQIWNLSTVFSSSTSVPIVPIVCFIATLSPDLT